MMVIPIVLAVAVNFFAPGIEDTAVRLALIDGETPKLAAYLEEYARVLLVEDYDALEARVMRRDDVIGIVGEGSGANLLVQGNEPGETVEYAKLLKTCFEYGRRPEDSTAAIHEFGVTISPVKML